jgi:hypothetical protein
LLSDCFSRSLQAGLGAAHRHPIFNAIADNGPRKGQGSCCPLRRRPARPRCELSPFFPSCFDAYTSNWGGLEIVPSRFAHDLDVILHNCNDPPACTRRT